MGGSLVAAPVSVKGELVEVACMKNGWDSSGPEHRQCAISCARGGAVLGILADDEVYEIVGDYTADRNAKLLDLIAEEVIAVGEVSRRDDRIVIDVTTIRIAK
jgi:hypothetical protein